MNIVKRTATIKNSIKSELEIFIDKESKYWKELKKSTEFSNYNEKDILEEFAFSYLDGSGQFHFGHNENIFCLNFLKKTLTAWAKILYEEEPSGDGEFSLGKEISISNIQQKYFILETRLENEKIYGHFFNEGKRKEKISSYLHNVIFNTKLDSITYQIDKENFFSCFEEIDPNQMELELGD